MQQVPQALHLPGAFADPRLVRARRYRAGAIAAHWFAALTARLEKPAVRARLSRSRTRATVRGASSAEHFRRGGNAPWLGTAWLGS
jgi:hypothetical protein